MACDYESEAVEKFLLPHQPDEGNYTSRVAYETTHKAYQCDHACVMEAHEQWKQHEQIKDAHHKAEAVRLRAVADKECREAAEQSRKHPHVKEVEDEADTPIECCKWRITKGMLSL